MNNSKLRFLRKSDIKDGDIFLSKYRLPFEDHAKYPQCLIIPDNVELGNHITFTLSIFNTWHENNPHMVIELMAILDASDMSIGVYVEQKNIIYGACPITSIKFPFMRFVSPKMSDELVVVIFDSDLINHTMCMYNDNGCTYVSVDDCCYEIIDVLFDDIKIDNVNLLKELKKLNVLQFVK